MGYLYVYEPTRYDHLPYFPVQLEGVLDSESADKLAQVFDSAQREQRRFVIFDMRGVRECGAAGWDVLFHAGGAFLQQGGAVLLCGAQAPVSSSIPVELREFFRFFGDLSQAERHCSGDPPESDESESEEADEAARPAEELSIAFADGKEVDRGDGSAVLRCRVVAHLRLPSGTVVACDPFTSLDSPPLQARLPRGEHPVVLTLADFGNDVRVAFARVDFLKGPPDRWEPAITVEKDDDGHAVDLDAGASYYGVDSGMGCFVDEQGARALESQMQANPAVSEAIAAAVSKNYVDTWSWADHAIQGASGANLIAFKSGWGDGAYRTYLGFRADGRLVCVLTDFEVV